MKILMIGDIVGQPGRQILIDSLLTVRREHQLDYVIANAENVNYGSGLTVSSYKKLLKSGVDCITLGDHAFRCKEIFPILDGDSPIVRPANFPPEAPGKGWIILETPILFRDHSSPILEKISAVKICVISLLGRVFMQPVDCPLHTVDAILKQLPSDVKIIIVDYHAEATSDKQLLGRYLDGRVSAVLGTHTHVATADEQIFPGGTGFQCDVGMTGPFKSIIGRHFEKVLETVRTFRPINFDVASEDVRINGTIIDIDILSGKTRSIERFTYNAQTDPAEKTTIEQKTKNKKH